MPHYVILSPFDQPAAYIAFAINWISSLVCIAASIYFYRRKKGTWWLLIAAAFVLPLLENGIWSLIHGLPPLPFGKAYPDQVSPTPPGYSTITTRLTEAAVVWDTVTPMLAIALSWAYFADRKKRAGGASTAQT
jgi:hypothetical protein